MKPSLFVEEHSNSRVHAVHFHVFEALNPLHLFDPVLGWE